MSLEVTEGADICEFDSDGITLLAYEVGSCTVVASQPGIPGQFDPAPSQQREFNFTAQQLALDLEVPSTASVTNTPTVDVTVVASVSNDQAFSASGSVSVSGGSSCSVEEGFFSVDQDNPRATVRVTLIAPPPEGGPCTVTAFSEGDITHSAGAVQTFTVTP